MKHNTYCPVMQVHPETYEVRADGELLTCEPADVYRWHSVISCFNEIYRGDLPHYLIYERNK